MPTVAELVELGVPLTHDDSGEEEAESEAPVPPTYTGRRGGKKEATWSINTITSTPMATPTVRR